MLKPDDLTRGERLLLDRRRRGVSQSDALDGVAKNVYRLWETDEVLDHAPLVEILEIHPHEQLLLIRRRRNMTQTQMAEQLGISLTWQKTLEAGGVTHVKTILKVLENLDVTTTKS